MSDNMDNTHTLSRLFEIQATKSPHQAAVIFNHQLITYEQLNHKANQLAHYLIEEGVEPDTLIAVFFERTPEFIIAVLGILKAGAAYIPLDTTWPYERLSLILQEAGNPLLITTRALKKQVCSYPGPLLELTKNKLIEKHPGHNPSILVEPHHLAYVIFTSGSTGTPKGVLIEQGALVNYILWFSQLYKQVAKIDFSSNHAFDFSITLYLVPLCLGLTVVICKDSIKKDPANYLNYLNRHAIDFIKLTPSYFKILGYEVHHQAVLLPHLKKIMLGGEQLSKAECESWLSRYPQHILYNEYGPTETTVAVTAFAIDKNTVNDLGENIPIGDLAINTRAYILNKELEYVEPGKIGELYVGGICLARGYLNNPELTQRYFIPDPFSPEPGARLYKTGDLCRRLPDSQFECLGRIDHQIKIRGFRIELDEIENYLNRHPALKAATVIASTLNQKEKSLIAYYILKNTRTTLKPQELSQFLRHYLPDYMIPAAFIRMDAFPLNANDKLDRAALPIPQLSPSRYYVPAKTRLEQTLASKWSEELGFSTIGIKDDFFELGGHSLSAARILSAINHELNIELSLSDFYANATISALVPIIKKAKLIEKKQNNLSRKLNNDTAVFPLSDFQFMLWIAHTFEPKAKKLNIFTRKRIHGLLDLKKLNKALECLLHKHEVLSYRVSRFRPGQYLIKNTPSTIIETSLQDYSDKEQEERLKESVYQLIHYAPWPKNTPQLVIRLFYLNDGNCELQLCMPHIISDDLTPEILLMDLSHFYTSDNSMNDSVIQDRSYRNYLLEEQFYFKKYLNRDISFWEDYLNDTGLYSFPTEYVVKNMRDKNYSYSTYIQIPDENLMDLSTFCATNHISILDGLCALVALALKNCSQNQNLSSLCINRVKSTRESHLYDQTAGCFLRIEPVKLDISKRISLSLLAQRIHTEVMNTNPYQRCPNLIKLASIGSFKKEKSIIKAHLAKTLFWFYSLLIQKPMYYETLKVLSRLNSIRDSDFLININVQSNFLTHSQSEPKNCFFGFQEQKIPSYHYDLLNINNLFDVNFLCMPDSKNRFLVLSANLTPVYREAIGKEMIRIMKEEIKGLLHAS